MTLGLHGEHTSLYAPFSSSFHCKMNDSQKSCENTFFLWLITFTFTFRVFTRGFYLKPLTISIFVTTTESVDRLDMRGRVIGI